MKRAVRADIIVIVVLLAAFGIWFCLSALPVSPTPEGEAGPVVVCQSSDGFYRCDPLDSDAAYTVTVSGTAAGTFAGENNVVIENGTVDVTSADCSNQVCVEHAPISSVGEQIVCLPHGVVIEVLAHEEDATVLS